MVLVDATHFVGRHVVILGWGLVIGTPAIFDAGGIDLSERGCGSTSVFHLLILFGVAYLQFNNILLQQLEHRLMFSPKSHHPIPNPSPQLLTLMRIYVVNLLKSEFNVESFTRDYIDILAMYAYRCIFMMVFQVKQLLAVQGRTVTNFLHIFAVYQLGNKSMDSLITHLIGRLEVEKKKRNSELAHRHQTRKLTKQLNLYENQAPDPQHPNILNIPCYFATKPEAYPLHRPMDDYLLKPPLYSYSDSSNHIEKRQIDEEQAIKQTNCAQNQLRVSLEKRRRPIMEAQNWGRDHSPLRTQNYPQKMLFSMCKYL